MSLLKPFASPSHTIDFHAEWSQPPVRNEG